ncbi:hypothetical protein GCM10010149_47790 [Nonomuraea roseoviolacea subsp. roseoviolacea]
MKVIVTGSRDWPDIDAVCLALWRAYLVAERGGYSLTVVHGGCATGADAMTSAWCRIAVDLGLNVVEQVFYADWRRGRRAGPERNRRMIECGADKVIAFNRNDSRGTTGTVRMAEEAGIPVEPYTIRDKEVA